jgi:hypothetical protein
MQNNVVFERQFELKAVPLHPKSNKHPKIWQQNTI